MAPSAHQACSEPCPPTSCFSAVQSDFRQPPGYAIFPVLKVTGKLRPSFLKVKSSVYCSKHTFCYNPTCGNALPMEFFYLVFISCLYVTHIIQMSYPYPHFLFRPWKFLLHIFSQYDDCFRKTYVKL